MIYRFTRLQSLRFICLGVVVFLWPTKWEQIAYLYPSPPWVVWFIWSWNQAFLLRSSSLCSNYFSHITMNECSAPKSQSVVSAVVIFGVLDFWLSFISQCKNVFCTAIEEFITFQDSLSLQRSLLFYLLTVSRSEESSFATMLHLYSYFKTPLIKLNRFVLGWCILWHSFALLAKVKKDKTCWWFKFWTENTLIVTLFPSFWFTYKCKRDLRNH